MTTASACAKFILCGEHAVVYGQPAIALPVPSLRATAAAVPAEHLTFWLEDIEAAPFDLTSDSPVAQLAQLVLRTLDTPPPAVRIHVKSSIPIASGLGSGAAISTAVARLLFQLAQQFPAPERLNPLVYEIEKLYHGTPSGIDNTVIAYEQGVYFVREQPIELVRVGTPLHFLIADTGIPAPTRISVGDVHRLYTASPGQIQPVLDEIGELAQQARQAIECGEVARLGDLMNRNHQLLQALTVSSPELDTLVTAAQQAGASGAKLSGGGRGGNMIALITEAAQPQVSMALVQAGAARVIATQIEAG